MFLAPFFQITPHDRTAADILAKSSRRDYTRRHVSSSEYNLTLFSHNVGSIRNDDSPPAEEPGLALAR